MSGKDKVVFDPDFEPLAAGLEPRFGNIYSEVGQSWTPELKNAIKAYLISNEVLPEGATFTEFPNGSFPFHLPERLLDFSRDPVELRRGQTEYIIEHYCPADIALGFHFYMMTYGITVLRDVIRGQTDAWTIDGSKDDVLLWFKIHGTFTRLQDLGRLLGTLEEDSMVTYPTGNEEKYPELLQELAKSVVSSKTPQEILHAWDIVTSTDH